MYICVCYMYIYAHICVWSTCLHVHIQRSKLKSIIYQDHPLTYLLKQDFLILLSARIIAWWLNVADII